jgi:uncharacterized protein YkwD
VLGVSYPLWGERLVASVRPDPDGCAGANAVPTESNEAETERATLCLLNARRAELGLAALRPSGALARAAREHSEDMGRRDFFAHDTPAGVEPARRIAAAGYPRRGVVVGENLAWGEEARATPAEIVEGWMRSPGHRANVLRPEFAEVGVGLAYDPPQPTAGRAAVYTTNFGGPLRG